MLCHPFSDFGRTSEYTLPCGVTPPMSRAIRFARSDAQKVWSMKFNIVLSAAADREGTAYYLVTRWEDLWIWITCATVGGGLVLIGTEMVRWAGAAV